MTTMATRSTASASVPMHECTEFVLHKTQQTKFKGIHHKIIDFSEYKLLKYADNILDAQQKLEIMSMIKDYRSGNLAVGWRRGVPCYVRVTKE